MIHRIGSIAILALVLALPASAQSPDFSGTWRLDKAASKINPASGLAGLGAGGAPDTLHVTHAANGTVVIGSEVNESQARAYRPERDSDFLVGRDRVVRVRTRIEGNRILVEGRQDEGGSPVALRETLTLSPNRDTLTIDVVTTTAQGEAQTTLVYKPATSAGPCQSWPTPCNGGFGGRGGGRGLN
jgi:hypothetical protein